MQYQDWDFTSRHLGFELKSGVSRHVRKKTTHDVFNEFGLLADRSAC